MLHRFLERFLPGNPGIHLDGVEFAQVLLIHPLKLFRHIHISVEIDIAVGRMVVFSVEIQKLLIGQIRNLCRVSSRLHAVGSIRKQHIENFPVQHFLRGGKCPLHLIVNHAVVFQRAILCLQLVAPAFLAEDFFLFIDGGIEHGIQIHMHQILKILIVAAGHRIHGLVRISHGVQECVQRSLHQLHKRILQREMPGSAQDTVLQNMGHTGAVRRRRPESNIEHLILVVVFQQHHARPALFMTQQIPLRVDIFDHLMLQHLICLTFCNLHRILLFFFRQAAFR